MPPVRPFLTSLYLSLAIAILAVGVAGGDLLPELPLVTVLSLSLLGIAYYLEGRWALSLRNANLVGLGLAALLGIWAIFQVVRPPTGLADTLPWPASALPYLAPVLMILIPSKLFRPKHTGDYWAMHGLGLLAMALACALAMDGVFILIFMAYAVVFVWSLTTFNLYRELGPDLARNPLPGGRWKAIRPAMLWAAITGAAAIPFFWATPRTGSEWELAINTRGRSLTGMPEGPVDLNKTGTVDVNQDRAFELFVTDANDNPVVDFPSDQRFRVLYLQSYDSGRWIRNQFGFQSADRAYSPPSPSRELWSRLPDFGPDSRRLMFILHTRQTRSAPLADPVAWRSGHFSPVASAFDNGFYRSWVHRHDGSLDGAFSFDAGPPRYYQVWAPPELPGHGPVMRIQPENTKYLTRLPRGMVQIKNYTDRLIERLVTEGALSPSVLVDVNQVGERQRRHHAAVARALEQHLASSGEFSYTLDLTRQDRNIDPAEDFLLNTKSGHCQRFATALVLMLRTQGIPAQMVVGYRGCVGRGDGWYDVREDHSHAWVEVLLPASDEGLPPTWTVAPALSIVPQVQALSMAGGSMAVTALTMPPEWQAMRWVTLDPTPAAPGDESVAASILGQARQKWGAVMKALLLTYNRDSREQAARAVQEWLTDDDGWMYIAAAGVAVVAFFGWRWRSRRKAAILAGYPDYVCRLASILMRHGQFWPPGKTAQEFATAAAAGLRSTSVGADVAEIPVRLARIYYAERFGGHLLSDLERRNVEIDLKRLARALG
jgi:hypothetical protein